MQRPHILLLTVIALISTGCWRRPLVQNKGSDTMSEVAQAWAARYRKVRPEVAIAVSGGGSGVGISALINGDVDLANSSRKIKPKELKAARDNGADPREYIVGYDALAVYVHRDNPLPSITLAQLAEIYGDGGKITRWSDLGVQMPDPRHDHIVVTSRQNNSGTYEYFKEAVLGKKREFRLGTLDLNGSMDVVDFVVRTPGAIGYSGLAFATPEVRLLPVARDAGSEPSAPTIDHTISGQYPISRPLFMYTRCEPAGRVGEYLEWILSDEGQRLLLQKGYPPVRKL